MRGRIVDRLRDVPRGAALPFEELFASLAAVIPADRVGEIPAVTAALERDGIVARAGGALRLA